MLITMNLWSGTQRLFPFTPAFDFIPVDFLREIQFYLYLFNLFLLMSMRYFERIDWLVGAFLLVSAFLILTNIHRLQVWFYQLSILLFLLSFRKKEAGVLNALRFSLIAIYCWSGFHKLNVFYIDSTFPWFLESTFFNAFGQNKILAIFSALLEMSIGIGLSFRSSRKWAVALGIMFHLFILASLGPWGHDWNVVIWPWNIAMIFLLLVLFFSGDQNWRFSLINDLRQFPPMLVPVVLIGILPALNIFNQWDEQLSFKMYAGTNMEGVFYFEEVDKNCFPEVKTSYRSLPPMNVPLHRIILDDWAFEELNVPPYTSQKSLKRLAKELCKCLKNPELGGIEILTVHPWKRDSEQFENIPCGDLK